MHGVLFWKTGQGMLGSGDEHMLLSVPVEPENKCCLGCLKGPVTPQPGCRGTGCLTFVCVLCCTHVLMNRSHTTSTFARNGIED